MMKINSRLIMEVVIIVTLVLGLALVISTDVFAADNPDPVIIGGGNANTANDVNNVENEIPNNTVYNTASNTSYKPTNTTTLPKTGVNDGYVVAVLVAVCAISAIYAYRKISDYNIK